MEKVDIKNLDKITGGSASVGMVSVVFLAITTVSVLLSGIFSGYTNPRSCNE